MPRLGDGTSSRTFVKKKKATLGMSETPSRISLAKLISLTRAFASELAEHGHSHGRSVDVSKAHLPLLMAAFQRLAPLAVELMAECGSDSAESDPASNSAAGSCSGSADSDSGSG